MPITQSAKKALKQSGKKAVFNQRAREKTRRLIRAFKKNPGPDGLRKVFSALDKASKKNVFHKNKASRLKGRLAKLLKKNKKETKASSKKKAPGQKDSRAKIMKKKR